MRTWWRDSTFDRRLRLYLSLVIVLTATVVLVVSTVSSMASITENSRNLLHMQVDTLSDTVDAQLTAYKDMAVAIMLGGDVRAYLEGTAQGDTRRQDAHINGVRDALGARLIQSDDIIFLCAIRAWPDDYVFRGAQSIRFAEVYPLDKARSVPLGYGDMQVTRGSYYNDKEVTLSLYLSMHSPVYVGRRTGELCMNVRAGFLSGVEAAHAGAIPFDARLVAAPSGEVLAATGREALGETYAHGEALSGPGGSFTRDGRLYLYERVGSWALYLVGEVPLSALYRGSLRTMGLLCVLIGLMVAAGLVLAAAMVRRMYASLSKLTRGMEAVSAGDLTARLEGAGEGRDMESIFAGFNLMAERTQALMERVKEEERQVEQIRFHTLQAQIHPHFLYNTLDCIRWMAAAGGNRDVEEIVKAMARYYRICLSRGRDVIALSQEIEFTRHYLTIQNIRFGGVIDCMFDIPDALLSQRIPKITLQPLVENYVNHGLKKGGEHGRLVISGRAAGESVMLEVSDDGLGMTEEAMRALNASIRSAGEADGIGYGVRNVHRRIQILFGPRYGLTYFANGMGGVSVMITLPRKEDAHV